MATIRNRLGKINMFTQGRDFEIPKYLAEKGLDVNVEYVRNGMDDGMLAIEVFETQEIKKRKMITETEWKENGRTYYWNNYRDNIRSNSDVALHCSKKEG